MSVINQVKAIFPESCWPDAWLVGGSVRDILLNQPIQDIDLVAAIPPAQLNPRTAITEAMSRYP